MKDNSGSDFLPVVFIESEDGHFKVPFPGNETFFVANDDGGDFLSIIKKEALVLVVQPALTEMDADEEIKELFGVLASVKEMKEEKNGTVEIFLIGKTRVAVKNTKLIVEEKGGGYILGQWVELVTVFPTDEEFDSEDFHTSLAQLIVSCQKVNALTNLKISDALRNVDFLFGDNGHVDPEAFLQFLEDTSNFLSHFQHLGKINDSYEKLICESSVMRRLVIASEAYLFLSIELSKSQAKDVKEDKKVTDLVVSLKNIPKKLPCLNFRPNKKTLGGDYHVMLPISRYVRKLRKDKNSKELIKRLNESPYIIEIFPHSERDGAWIGLLAKVIGITTSARKQNSQLELFYIHHVEVENMPADLKSKEIKLVAWKAKHPDVSEEELKSDNFKGNMQHLYECACIAQLVYSGVTLNDAENTNIPPPDLESIGAGNMANEFYNLTNRIHSIAKPKDVYSEMVEIYHESSVARAVELAIKMFEGVFKKINAGTQQIETISSVDEFTKARRPGSVDSVDFQNDTRPREFGVELDVTSFHPEAESLKLFLENQVVGQKRAIQKIVEAYDFYLSPIWTPNAPVFAGLFCGPSGVGKTFTAEKLAEYFFDNDKCKTKVLCENLPQAHHLSKLVGASPEYIGYGDRPILGQEKIDFYGIIAEIRSLEKKISETKDEKEINRLRTLLKYWKSQIEPVKKNRGGSIIIPRTINDVMKHPVFSTILFDELEKANSAIHRFLLEVLSKGGTTLGGGDDASFIHSFIIMTSNSGSVEIAKAMKCGGKIGFANSEAGSQASYDIAMREIEKVFPPEFIGRIEHNIVVFDHLSREDSALIMDKLIGERLYKLRENFPIDVEVDDRAKEFILEESTDHPQLGARLIAHKIDKFVFRPIGRLINTGKVMKGDVVLFRLTGSRGEKRVVASRKKNTKK